MKIPKNLIIILAIILFIWLIGKHKGKTEAATVGSTKTYTLVLENATNRVYKFTDISGVVCYVYYRVGELGIRGMSCIK